MVMPELNMNTTALLPIPSAELLGIIASVDSMMVYCQPGPPGAEHGAGLDSHFMPTYRGFLPTC